MLANSNRAFAIGNVSVIEVCYENSSDRRIAVRLI